MTRSVDFYFDFGSLASYLAWTQLPTLAAETGAQLVIKPMLLGGVFKATGNQSPASVPAKGRWIFIDFKRWAARYGVPLELNPHFPVNTLALMRGAVGMQMRQPQDFRRYADAMFRAMWVDKKNLGDPAVVAEVLRGAGFDPAGFEALVADPEVKARLIALTDEAVQRGVFGAPTFFVGDQMFWGQDRMDFVREALRA